MREDGEEIIYGYSSVKRNTVRHTTTVGTAAPTEQKPRTRKGVTSSLWIADAACEELGKTAELGVGEHKGDMCDMKGKGNSGQEQRAPRNRRFCRKLAFFMAFPNMPSFRGSFVAAEGSTIVVG